MNNEKIKPIFNCCNNVAKVIPLAFDESMSYYEQVCMLVSKINEVIYTFNNMVTEEVIEYINKTFNDIMINTMYDEDNETLVLYLDHENNGGVE